MSEWKKYKISEVIDEISMGPFGSDVKKEVYVESGVPILNGSNLQGFKLQEDSFGYLTEEKADSLKKSNAKRGDVIVTHRGTLGQIVYIPEDSKYTRYVISQSQFRFSCKTDIVRPDYLTYYFHTPIGQYKLLSNASQVGVPALARATSTFRTLDVDLPSIECQNKIMAILLSLDDKIAVNRRICENLEAQAQALFKNWFVDFAPFKNGKFVESELGMIPEGWRVGTLGEILVDIETGKRQKGGALSDGIPSIGAEKIEGICSYNFNSEKYISKDFYYNMSKGKIKSKDVLLYKDGAYTGKSTMFMNDFPYRECAVNEHVFLLRTRNSQWQAWLYLLLSQENNRKYIYTLAASKAAQPGLNQTELQSVKIVIPDNDILYEFEDIALSFFEPIIQNLKENHSLSTLRDTLLPKLMSGELEINNI